MSEKESTTKPATLTRHPPLKRPSDMWDFPIPDSLVPFPAAGSKDDRPLRMSTDFWGRVLVRRIQQGPGEHLIVLGDMFTGDGKDWDQLPCLLVVRNHMVEWYAVAAQHREAVKRVRLRIPAWLAEDASRAIRGVLECAAKAHDERALRALSEEIVTGERLPSGRRKRTEAERWLAHQLEDLRSGDPGTPA